MALENLLFFVTTVKFTNWINKILERDELLNDKENEIEIITTDEKTNNKMIGFVAKFNDLEFEYVENDLIDMKLNMNELNMNDKFEIINKIIKICNDIYDKYVKDYSIYQINISYECRQYLDHSINNLNKINKNKNKNKNINKNEIIIKCANLFDDAMREVWINLNSIYRFQFKSKMGRRILHETFRNNSNFIFFLL